MNKLRSLLPILLGLFLAVSANAQSILLPAADSALQGSRSLQLYQNFPANKRWGWFHPLRDEIENFTRGSDWALDSGSVKTKGRHTAASLKNKTPGNYVSFDAYDGFVVAVMLACPKEHPENMSAILEGTKGDGKGRWIDRDHNAVITRSYSGPLIVYKVAYEPYSVPPDK